VRLPKAPWTTWWRCRLPAEDVLVLPPARSGYGEELLVPSPCGACLRELPGKKSSSLSLETAREFSWWRRQVDYSPASHAKLPLRKRVQEEGLRGRCSFQSSRTCNSPPQGFQRYHPCGGNRFLYFVAVMGRLCSITLTH
jgi:hypothetical protein